MNVKKGLITIRRRKEPIEVSEERARKIKLARFGDVDGHGKMPDDSDIDLGDAWSGKIDQIVSVEIVNAEGTAERKVYDPEAEWKVEETRLLKLPPEKRATFGMFKLSWYIRSGQKEKEPPAKVMEQANKLATAFFKKNPNVAVVPASVLEPLLVKAFGERKPQSLAESKRIPLSTD